MTLGSPNFPNYSKHTTDDFKKWLFVHIGCTRCPSRNFLHRGLLDQGVVSTSLITSKCPPLSHGISKVAERKRVNTIVVTHVMNCSLKPCRKWLIVKTPRLTVNHRYHTGLGEKKVRMYIYISKRDWISSDRTHTVAKCLKSCIFALRFLRTRIIEIKVYSLFI